MNRSTLCIRWSAVLGAVIWVAVCFGAPGNGAAQTHRPVVENIDSLLSIYYLTDDADSRSDKIADDSLQSVHLHQIRTGIESHKHARHAVTVWVIRGAGRLTIDGEERRVYAGTIVTIPPGTTHSFYSLGKKPAVLISVFSPAFDGKDRIYDNGSGQ